MYKVNANQKESQTTNDLYTRDNYQAKGYSTTKPTPKVLFRVYCAGLGLGLGLELGLGLNPKPTNPKHKQIQKHKPKT